jgi:hypothetical protein
MPQITVTLSDEAYWELRQIVKGKVSAFCNAAFMDAVKICAYEPEAYNAYVKGGIVGAREALQRIDARNNPNQTKLDVEE